jgi:Flp pilus assembly protein TadB
VSVGLPVGICLGTLVVAESGSWLAGASAILVLSPLYGVRAARRMTRLWPGAADVAGADRVAAVRAARRGERIAERRLAPAVLEYADALRKAREEARLSRRLVVLLAGLALAVALIDSFTEPLRGVLVSWLVFALLILELAWWPRRQRQLMANVERAESGARDLLSEKNSADK